ncbi:MAG TPA: glycosyltransferase [Dehalococcoidia bacterium]
MRVAILTWGSRGDYQPYLALASALQRAGHEVRMGAPIGPNFQELANRYGVDVLEVGPPVESEVVNEAIEGIDFAALNPVSLVRMALDHLLAEETWEAMYNACLELAEWSDVVVSHFLQVAGRMAADAADRPWVSGTLVPTQLPTATRSPGGSSSRVRFLNKRAWSKALGHMNGAWLPPVNEARARIGLAPMDDVAARGFYSPSLNLVAASPTVFPRPGDWSAEHRLTGYWLAEAAADWSPSPELMKFVSEGERPIAIGFGSMPTSNRAALNRTLLDAIERAGVKAVVEPGMAELSAGNDAASIMHAAVPHAWLLPRVSVLVHHGGAGTAGAAFHAGVPQVIVPHLYDQAIWADRAHQLGVSPPPIAIARLTAHRLSDAISRAATDSQIRESSRQLAEVMSGESGATEAALLIEEYASEARNGALETNVGPQGTS